MAENLEIPREVLGGVEHKQNRLMISRELTKFSTVLAHVCMGRMDVYTISIVSNFE